MFKYAALLIMAFMQIFIFGLICRETIPVPEVSEIVEIQETEPQLPRIQRYLTTPLCQTYRLADGHLIKWSSLRGSYFECTVLKEVKPEYLLIRITQNGYQHDVHIVHKDSLIVVS